MTEIIYQFTFVFKQLLGALLNPLLLMLSVILLIAFIFENKRYKSGTYYQTTHIPLLRLRFDLGKYGEYLIYKQLRHFEKDNAKFLFNVYVPKDNGETTEIDVLMITSNGIFVFESKNYSGWIFGNENKKTWYQTLPYGRGRSRKVQFYNPIMQNRSHINHLQSLLEYPVPMYSIIVFSERCTLKNISLTTPEIKVINRNRISSVVSEISKAVSENLLSNQNVSELYDKLYPYTQVSEAAKKRHISNIKSMLTDKAVISQNAEKTESIENAIDAEEAVTVQNAEPIHASVETIKCHAGNADDTDSAKRNNERLCPKCGGKLILRTAAKGANVGTRFWGCDNFPKCRYTEKIK